MGRCGAKPQRLPQPPAMRKPPACISETAASSRSSLLCFGTIRTSKSHLLAASSGHSVSSACIVVWPAWPLGASVPGRGSRKVFTTSFVAHLRPPSIDKIFNCIVIFYVYFAFHGIPPSSGAALRGSGGALGGRGRALGGSIQRKTQLCDACGGAIRD